jgi:hypothetical protein
MSDRTASFIARWRFATNGIDLGPLTARAIGSINPVATAESLAEAHRLAQESLTLIRETAPHIEAKIRAEVYRRDR